MNVSNETLIDVANARVTAFTVSELIRENQKEESLVFSFESLQ